MNRGVLLRLAFAGWALACASAFAQLPGDIMLPNDLPPKKKPPALPNQLPQTPTLSPAIVVAGHPLGFTPPSSIYLGRRDSLLSLDFLDEDHLLFSFREPGLIKREREDDEGLERQMRAAVLSLPDGKVQAQATWTIPDRSRYLWMLEGGHFLLKDRGGLETGDVGLKMRPVLKFPDTLQSLSLDPGQQIMLATMSEAPQAAQQGSQRKVPVAARDSTPTDTQDSAGAEGLTLRVIDRQSLETLHTLHTRAGFDAPINGEGYAEAEPGKKYQWIVRFHSFAGGSRVLHKVQSGCPPALGFISNRVLVVTSCTPDAMLKLDAISSLDGKITWEFTEPPEVAWPLLVPSPSGTRFARVSMVLKPGVKTKNRPRFGDAVQGQIVRVFDFGNGKPIFEAPVTPALDGGGNVAFSPSGRRLALINRDSIQVFDLPQAAQ